MDDHDDQGDEPQDEGEADDEFGRAMDLWGLVEDVAEASGVELNEEELAALRQLANESGLDIQPGQPIAEFLVELKSLYRAWARRLTRDAGQALGLPRDKGQPLLEAFIEDCPIKFLRSNAEGFIVAIQRRP